LLDLIKENKLPYRFTGTIKNCKRVANKIPDFTHKKEKKLIELFGEYWHPRSDEEKRIKHFKEHGYSCLVIWCAELRYPNKVLEKIRRF
jgi:very-short-patch-repair endonuclease